MTARAARSVGLLIVTAAVAIAATHAPSAGARRRAGGECVVPGRSRTIDRLWHPRMNAAVAYTHSRAGDIAFAVRTEDRFYGYRPDHVEWSASVVNALLMVAYLDEPRVAGRPIDATDNALLIPMVTVSDNNAASRVDEIVGSGGLDALARRVGMTHFAAAAPVWGETQITARDQTRFFLHLDRYIVARHRAYGMHLLASVVPSERWGIGEVAPRGWTAYFKGGSGYGTGLVDPSGRAAQALLRPRGDRRAHHVRRLARLRQGDAAWNLHAAASRLPAVRSAAAPPFLNR